MRSLKKRQEDPARHLSIANIREWARQRFSLGDDDTITVTEIECAAPGCPPLETIIVFWVGPLRHHVKIFKPVTAVTIDDFPPAWFRPALAVDENALIECC
jgi:nitrate reductase delta subunit